MKCSACDVTCELECKGEEMRIGIVGFGTVGQALFEYYDGQTHGEERLVMRNGVEGLEMCRIQDHEVYTYDKRTDRPGELDHLNSECDVVFVCVNTPYAKEKRLSSRDGHHKVMEGQGLDCENVYDAVEALTGEKTVIIKSTVNPGTTDELQRLYPQHRIFFVPEFLSEATAAEDYANPRRAHVIGVPDGLPLESIMGQQFVTLLPQWRFISNSRIFPARQAELLKLSTNAFYALKVTFANQLYDIGATQEMLDALGADPWIGGEHFTIDHKKYRGYGGACLVKDTRALADVNTSDDCMLLDHANDYNAALLVSQGVDIAGFLGVKDESNA
jgi:UDP-glucose 6-dehydrogenase